MRSNQDGDGYGLNKIRPCLRILAKTAIHKTDLSSFHMKTKITPTNVWLTTAELTQTNLLSFS